MPHRLFARSVRQHIADLRSFTLECNPWRHAPDEFLLAPVMLDAHRAAANTIEYLVDTHGPEAGIDAWRGLLMAHLEVLPLPLDDVDSPELELHGNGNGSSFFAGIQEARDARAKRLARGMAASPPTEPYSIARIA